ncbi:hypothetical protein DMUE_2334 [Dictyocoela muelleri]|nr:hypothetical protein DMUE_2334 [Dictyocoela muelleri]
MSQLSKKQSLQKLITRRRYNHFNHYIMTSDIPDELKNTISGEKFLQYDSGVNDDKRILIFFNQSKIYYLTNSDTYLGDGTLKMALRYKIKFIKFIKKYIAIFFQLFMAFYHIKLKLISFFQKDTRVDKN